MYALAVQNIPEGKEWLYEVKFDGYRCLAGRDERGRCDVVTPWKSPDLSIPEDCPRLRTPEA